jgi:dihydrofolate reductase
LKAKAEGGWDLHIVGSSRLTQSLVQHDLVDVFRLMIIPMLIGGGKRFLSHVGAARPLRLVYSQVTTTGAMLATYQTSGG